MNGSGSVNSSAIASSIQHAKNLPSTNDHVVTGTVDTNSSVPERRSSLHIRIVSAAHRKSSSSGNHSNIGRTSAMLRAKNASPQKNTNSVIARKLARNR